MYYLKEVFKMIRKRFMKESDYNDYKERISDYLDENGL
jgi:hypothetical protein